VYVLSSLGVLQGLEAYGIFKIGEIIGRRNLVGYKLKE
jgi:F-type H+-transporting ATPase subunit g